MNKTQKGFAVLELILLLIIVLVIGGTGWYVIKSKNQTSQILDITDKTNLSTPINKASDKSTNNFNSLPFKYSYPANWSKTDNGDNKSYYTVYLEAPGTMIDGTPDGGGEVETGAQFSISKTVSQSYKSLQEYKAASIVTSQYGTNKKDLTVGGREAMQFDLAYEGGPNHNVVFFDNGILYSVSVQQTVYANPSYGTVFDNLVSSIDFE